MEVYLCYWPFSCRTLSDPAQNLQVSLPWFDCSIRTTFDRSRNIALTSDFFFAHQIAPYRPFNRACFKRVASEEHSSNGAFRCLTLGNSLKYTKLGHQERNREPELGIHIELNVSVCFARSKIKMIIKYDML